MFDHWTTLELVIYGIGFLVPVAYLVYNHHPYRSSRFSSSINPSTVSIPAEDPKKPTKTIMQAPRGDLAPPKDDPFTPDELTKFNGSEEGKPIYVAIKGDIFDVTLKKDVYGPGKSYNIFAGKDGSRGLGKSSLKPEDAVADYSTLDEKEMKVLDDWHSFFSKRYNIIGRVVQPSNL